MATPGLIEYILSLERNPGERLVATAMNQYDVPICPPGQTFTIDVMPGEGEHAYIAYLTAADPNMIPRALQVAVHQFGFNVYGGIVEGWLLNNQVESFLLITKTQPYRVRLSNLSNLSQYYSAVFFYLVIKTKEDLDFIKEALKRYGQSTKNDALAQETNALLRVLAGPSAYAVPKAA